MPEWITYDWQVRGEPAEFTANIEEGLVRATHATLLFVAVSPGKEGAPFSAQETRRLRKLEKQLLKRLPEALYVGHIFMDTLHQFYFYVEDAAAAKEAVEQIADKEQKLVVSPGTAEEPEWTTYRHLLYPSPAKMQTIYNQELIRMQQQAGDALTPQRRVSFLLCFPTEQQRLQYQFAAKEAGFALGESLFQPELELPHVQTLYVISSLEKRDIDAKTTKAIEAAIPCGGEFLRWTCPKRT